MDRGKKAGLVVLGIVLFVVLLSANAAITVERTALDADYTKETAEESGLYGALEDQISTQITSGASGGNTGLPIEQSPAELLAGAITEEYVESQIEDNIDTVYAYLNGETDELTIDFESEPVKERVLTEVEADVENLEPTDVPMPNAEAIEAMAESESEFEDRREAFRAEQKQRIQEETEEELSDEELERILDDRMDEYRQQARSDVEAEVENELQGAPAELTEPIVALQMARIDALTGELTYEEYTTEVDTATDDLGDAVVSAFETRLDEELPETVDVTNQLGQQQRDQLETARTVVSASGPVAYGLAVLAIVVAGIVAWLAPLEIAAIEIGVISAIVGAVGAVGSSVATDPVRTAIQDAGAPMGFESFVQAFVVGILRTLQWQSVLLVVVGVVLVAVGIALRREYIELPERYAGS